jgi:hypothetical protein
MRANGSRNGSTNRTRSSVRLTTESGKDQSGEPAANCGR